MKIEEIKSPVHQQLTNGCENRQTKSIETAMNYNEKKFERAS